MVAIILAFYYLINQLPGRWINSIILVDCIYERIHFSLGEPKHMFKGRTKGKKCSDIITGSQILNSNWEDSGNKYVCNRSCLSAFFKHLEKGPEKTVPRCDFLVQPVLIQGNKLVYKVIIFINNYIYLGESGFKSMGLNNYSSSYYNGVYTISI